MNKRLFDPQLYFSSLDARICRRACAYLATYPWFHTEGLPEYDSAQHRQTDWSAALRENIHNIWTGRLPTTTAGIEDAVRAALNLQAQLRCEALILPVPLTTEAETSFSSECEWLDAGLEISSRMPTTAPRLATLAISDTCLRLRNPWENALIDLIVDQITAREPDGAYIVLELMNEQGYYCSNPNTVGALLRIIYELKKGGVSKVVVSFAGVAGMLALIAGADCWSSAWYRSERRFRLADAEDQDEGPRSRPAYYSHAAAMEFHMTDLERVVSAGLLNSIADNTPPSTPLIRALQSGTPIAAVADWTDRVGNVTASRAHFNCAALRETRTLASLSDSERVEYAKRWINNACSVSDRVSQMGSLKPRTETRHQASWKQALDLFLSATGQ